MTSDGPFRNIKPTHNHTLRHERRKHYDDVLVMADVPKMVQVGIELLRGRLHAARLNRAFWEILAKRYIRSLHLFSVSEIHLMLQAFDLHSTAQGREGARVRGSFQAQKGGGTEPVLLLESSEEEQPSTRLSGRGRGTFSEGKQRLANTPSDGGSSAAVLTEVFSATAAHLGNFRLGHNAEYHSQPGSNNLRFSVLLSAGTDWGHLTKNTWSMQRLLEMVHLFVKRSQQDAGFEGFVYQLGMHAMYVSWAGVSVAELRAKLVEGLREVGGLCGLVL